VSQFNRDEFNKFLIDNRVVGFFDKPVKLKSGRKSHWYVNWRTVSGDVFLIDRLADFLIDFIKDKELLPESFYGVPEGATKLGIIATYKWAKAKQGFGPGTHALPMGRGKPKEHGVLQDRYFLTPPREKVVVVEDVTTTGGSLLTVLDQLAELNVLVLAAIGLTNRMELRDDGMSVEEAVKKRGVQYYALSRANDFLPEVYRAYAPGNSVGEAIEKEFAEYGAVKIKLCGG
jgi:orotate phosphoribosyltransferase